MFTAKTIFHNWKYHSQIYVFSWMISDSVGHGSTSPLVAYSPAPPLDRDVELEGSLITTITGPVSNSV
jgi:hypothetical protein